MPRKIDDFLGKHARPDKIKQFEQLSKGKSKEEIRILEQKMLGPEPLQQHIGEEMRYAVNSEHTVKFVFRSQEEMDFFGRFITISDYIEKCITDIKIILDLCQAIDDGKITYDKKSGEFHFIGAIPAAVITQETPHKFKKFSVIHTDDLAEPEEEKVEVEVENTANRTESVRKFFRR